MALDGKMMWWDCEGDTVDSDIGVWREGYGVAVEIMQYIGLKDKNGTEVYEGDIVKCDSSLGCPHEIVWREAAPFDNIGGWGLKGTNSTYDWIGGEEVIGNIYENKELLK